MLNRLGSPAWFVTLSIALSGPFTVGCGSSESPSGGDEPTQPGSGGVGPGVGSGGDGSVTETGGNALAPGGDVPLSREQQVALYPPAEHPLTACREYVVEQCQARNQCWGESSDCWQLAVRNCPEVAFGPGSTRDASLIASCAERWAEATCAQAVSFDFPECFPPGTRDQGEACGYSVQCASGHCQKDAPSGCGICGPTLQLGDICWYNDECQPGHVCLDGQCSDDVQTQLEQIASHEDPCDACTENQRCAYEAGASQNQCFDAPAVGQPCLQVGELFVCRPGDYCAKADETCRARPGIGQACGVDVNEYHYCEDSTCAEDLVCRAVPGKGEPCASRSPGDVWGLSCQEGMGCVEDLCLEIRVLGQSCGANEHCEHGTECTNGVCEPGPLDAFERCE